MVRFLYFVALTALGHSVQISSPKDGLTHQEALHVERTTCLEIKDSTTVSHRIFFQHIWKTSGTNFNRMAVRNEEAFYHHECQDKMNWDSEIKDKAFTFVDHPGPLQKQFLLNHSNWTFITIIREPRFQAMSSYMHHHNPKLKTEFVDWLAPEKRHRTLLGDAAYFMDNQHARWMCGDDCLDCVNADFTEGCYKRAVANLNRMDYVFIMEDFDRIDKCRMKKLGWVDLQSRQHNSSTPLEGSYNHELELSWMEDHAIAAKLDVIQSWDSKLYKHAQDIARMQRLRDNTGACE
eukprot:gnl/TRDRNA2_/TRDRNA2_44304_c0_seq1.p1 gnl/TRDRNA2_/TRDRNA2_44304_c0~~gnl/TRDRNA2_/TRDRNA2_44304_c0_seq1.p1  ORF type:complete len:292 (+),score=33.17 gnl/TRDRNA2_/TRDRNA2_44304_c0_seq1:47-922(+)